jgi:hypothetical protein
MTYVLMPLSTDDKTGVCAVKMLRALITSSIMRGPLKLSVKKTYWEEHIPARQCQKLTQNLCKVQAVILKQVYYSKHTCHQERS